MGIFLFVYFLVNFYFLVVDCYIVEVDNFVALIVDYNIDYIDLVEIN